MTAVRVYVATTEGPSEIQRIAEEDPEVRSVVCLDGTSEALPISAAYDAFVRKPTGVIERLFGHSVYRVDVATRISEGRSWQLGLFAAHALKAAGRLAQRGQPAERAIWLTGTVDSDLRVGAVEHIAGKLKRSAALFADLQDRDIPVTAFVPRAAANQVAGASEGDDAINLGGVWVVPAETADAVCRHLGLPHIGRASKPAAKRLRGRVAAYVAILMVAAAGAAGFTWRAEIGGWLGSQPGTPPTVADATHAADTPPGTAADGPAETTDSTSMPGVPAGTVQPAQPSVVPASATDAGGTGSSAAPASESQPSADSEPAGPPEPQVVTGPNGEPAPEPTAVSGAVKPDDGTPAADQAGPELSAGDIKLSAVEKRAPRGRSCAIAGFGNNPFAELPVASTEDGQIPPSRAAGLCAVAYRVSNRFSEPVEVWVFAAPTGARNRFGATTSATERRRLAPGETAKVELTLPRWISEPLRHRLIVVASAEPNDEAFRSVDEGMAAIQASFDFARWADLRERIVESGMTLISSFHEITP